MDFHPLANLFPLMEGREFANLVADIEAHGCREPIYLLNNQILDGRNRWRACEALGARPTLVEYEGDDPAAFVISLNLHRRHLDESQRAMVAAKLANLEQGARRDLSPIGGKLSQGEAAALLNVGKRSVERAREVIKHGNPELVHAVEQGRVKVSAAVKKVKKAERVEKVTRLAATVTPVSQRYQVHLKPCADLVHFAPESVDFVITDPPYPKEYLSVLEGHLGLPYHTRESGCRAALHAGRNLDRA